MNVTPPAIFPPRPPGQEQNGDEVTNSTAAPLGDADYLEVSRILLLALLPMESDLLLHSYTRSSREP